MKRALFFALCLAAALWNPALSAADPPQVAPALSAVDRAFIASIAGPAVPVPAARRPDIGGVGEKALCFASANCWDGSTVSCEGNNSTASCTATDSNCSAGQRGSVTCDGVTTWCPACPCDLDCATERAICQMECYPCPISFSCSLSTCTTFCHCRFSQCPV